MNLKELAGTITVVAGAATILGTVIYKTGWVVNVTQAQEIAQQKANEVQQMLIAEQVTRSRRDAQLQKDLIILELSYLDETEDLTPGDERRKQSLERQLARIEEELDELDKKEAP